jgi:hypothetical protein
MNGRVVRGNLMLFLIAQIKAGFTRKEIDVFKPFLANLVEKFG